MDITTGAHKGDKAGLVIETSLVLSIISCVKETVPDLPLA